MYAGTIVERHNGTVVRDLKTAVTEIGQVYVQCPFRPVFGRQACGNRAI